MSGLTWDFRIACEKEWHPLALNITVTCKMVQSKGKNKTDGNPVVPLRRRHSDCCALLRCPKKRRKTAFKMEIDPL
ncbi:hypothetical protein NC651_005322 [Populus alba x Populus x berolinensis]|nr:hypothetical protein NC651_005322 [Populus alba x Populus x berolinensis]